MTEFTTREISSSHNQYISPNKNPTFLLAYEEKKNGKNQKEICVRLSVCLYVCIYACMPVYVCNCQLVCSSQ